MAYRSSGRGRIGGIFLEIGGDTSKLQQALKDAERSSKQAENALRAIDKALKLDPKNTELVAARQRELQTAIAATSEKLEVLRKTDAEAKKQLEAGKLGAENYAKLQTEIYYTEKRLKELQGEATKSYQALDKISNTSRTAGEKLNRFGDTMTRRVTMPVAGLVTGLGALAIKSGETADELITLSDKTGISIEKPQEMSYATVSSILSSTR